MERLTKTFDGLCAGDNTVAYIGQYKQYDADIPIEMSTAAVREVLKKLAAYEDTGLEPEEILNLQSGVIPAHWGDLFRAECDDRLVVLPRKLGDTIYILRGDVKNGYETVKKTHVEEVQFRLGCLDKQMKLYPFYYLTRTEAEAAMKGVSEDA